MLWVALTLGLMGSLHCVGMCGPLAIAFGGGRASSTTQSIYQGISYNLGRAITYAFLGLLFGSIGSFIVFSHAQKSISILLGLIMIIAFFASLDLEYQIRKLPLVQRWYQKVQLFLAKVMEKSKSYPAILLGMANGLLPCGLVYLALAGALTAGGYKEGMIFMFIFGIGTLPMLFVLSLGSQMVPYSVRHKFQKIIPYVTLGFGIFLCYRGLMVDMPAELNFWEAIRQPIMCH